MAKQRGEFHMADPSTHTQRRTREERRTVKEVGTTAILLVALLLVPLLGCAPTAIGVQTPEERAEAIQATVEELANALDTQQSQSDAAADERLVLQAQIGELARRIAEDEFDRFEGQEKGLLDFDTALQMSLKELNRSPDQSYLLEDIVFLPEFASFQPDSRVGPVWQLTIRGPTGCFIVTIDASSGGLVFVSRVGEGE
jgi:uncharacterized protein HemX